MGKGAAVTGNQKGVNTMTEIYTPKQWRSIFGCPSLIIDDKGYIYSAEEYRKLLREPIGWIDYSRNNIYGKDYNTVFATPIAYMVQSGNLTKVFEYGKTQFSEPILCIQNDKIYTYDEYVAWFGEPNGFIRTDKPRQDQPREEKTRTEPARESYSGGGGGSIPGAGIIGLALLIGIIYILSDEGRLANAAMVLALLVNAGAGLFLLVKKAQGKLYFNFDSKRFGKAVLTGLGVYVAATAVLVILGLGSNIGTGNHISDQGGDHLELAAMLMGIPFVISGLFSETPGSKANHTGGKKPPRPTASPKPGTSRMSKPKAQPGGFFGYNHKLVSCPYCRKIFNAKFPIGVKEIEMDCPKCGRRLKCRYK